MSQVKEVTYSERHHVNMGSFEWVELLASATVIATDGEAPDVLLAEASAIVQQHLADDLERAIVTTGEEETYVETWVDGPKRRKVTRRKR